MTNTYTKRPCGLCGKVIKTSGVAMTSHMMSHVRKGEINMWEKHGQKVYYNNSEDSYDAVPVSHYF